MSIAAVILAAGFSRRLGRPKQAVLLHDETLLDRAVRIAGQASLAPVFVVAREPHACLNAQVVLNHQASEGIASSIRAGVAAAQSANATGVVLLTCDQPTLTPLHLHQLCAQPETITGSSYAGKTGIPAYFPASAFAALLQLKGDTGARELLRHARAVPDESLALDIDTEADILRAQAQVAQP